MTAPVRLLRWSDDERAEFERLIAALTRVRAAAAAGTGELVVAVPRAPAAPDDLDRARAVYTGRRARDAAAGADADLFSDPAWDMLLALFVAEGEGRAVPPETVAAAANLGARTAARWVRLLADRGLVAVAGAVSLTPRGRELVRACVGAI